MRIGEFAARFDLNISTVRYYVNNSLLIPKRKNGQYFFDKQCVRDMETILRLKNYYFTIDEIQLFMFLEKTSRFKDDVILELCREILEKKKSELIRQRNSIDECITEIDSEIDTLPVVEPDTGGAKGIPFSFIPNLYCPHCNEPLKLDSASISDGYLNSGELWCGCGYRARIDNGILICEGSLEGTPLKSFENIETVLAMRDQFSPRYRSLIEKTYSYMYNRILKGEDEQRFILTGPLQLNFLLSFIEKLGKNNVYIVVDPSIKKLEKMHTYLNETGCNIVYMAGTMDEIPVRNNSVDIYVDDYCLANCIFTKNEFNAKRIYGLLKRKGIVTGIFGNYAKAPRSLSRFSEFDKDFDPKKMSLNNFKTIWRTAGFNIRELKSAGFTSEREKDYEQDVLGEQLEVLGYYAEKEKR